jgi:hypothetical protein
MNGNNLTTMHSQICVIVLFSLILFSTILSAIVIFKTKSPSLSPHTNKVIYILDNIAYKYNMHTLFVCGDKEGDFVLKMTIADKIVENKISEKSTITHICECIVVGFYFTGQLHLDPNLYI